MKILFFDLETAPNKAYIWSLWNEVKNMDYVSSPWYVLCWSAKWLGEKEIMSAGVNNSSENDKSIIRKLRKLFDKADVVVAHNAKKFDVRRVNTRFIANGMTPPSSYRVVDTLLEARRSFSFTSNRLNDLGKFFGLGEKIDTGGFELWKQCMAGNKVAWNKMVRYCKNDVVLLEKIYLKLRPYMKQHPNLGIYENRELCPKCGSGEIQNRGYAYTNQCKYQQFVCKNCGAWARGKKALVQGTLANV